MIHQYYDVFYNIDKFVGSLFVLLNIYIYLNLKLHTIKIDNVIDLSTWWYHYFKWIKSILKIFGYFILKLNEIWQHKIFKLIFVWLFLWQFLFLKDQKVIHCICFHFKINRIIMRIYLWFYKTIIIYFNLLIKIEAVWISHK